MHPPVFHASVFWLALLLGVLLIQAVRARTLMNRVLAFDTVTLVLVALLALFAHQHRSSYYLDAALVLALLSFLGTLAAARYHSQGGVF